MKYVEDECRHKDDRSGKKTGKIKSRSRCSKWSENMSREVCVCVCVSYLKRFIGGIAVNRMPPKYGSSVLSNVR